LDDIHIIQTIYNIVTELKMGSQPGRFPKLRIVSSKCLIFIFHMFLEIVSYTSVLILLFSYFTWFGDRHLGNGWLIHVK